MAMSNAQLHILRDLVNSFAAAEGYTGVQGTGAPGTFIIRRGQVDAALQLTELNLISVVSHPVHGGRYAILPRDAKAWAAKGWQLLPLHAVREWAAQQGRDTKAKRDARKAGEQ